ncbi:unnamed protein product [Gadus morhua 'NCC']
MSGCGRHSGDPSSRVKRQDGTVLGETLGMCQTPEPREYGLQLGNRPSPVPLGQAGHRTRSVDRSSFSGRFPLSTSWADRDPGGLLEPLAST